MTKSCTPEHERHTPKHEPKSNADEPAKEEEPGSSPSHYDRAPRSLIRHLLVFVPVRLRGPRRAALTSVEFCKGGLAGDLLHSYADVTLNSHAPPVVSTES